jgi:hypothetical protein
VTSPPNRVEPGFIHRKIATGILRALQDKASATVGAPVSVGELPLPVAQGGNGEMEDGREPVELLARVIAHVAHRIPGLKKVEKRLEGNDARSGLGSDLLALVSQLVSRNEELAFTMAEGITSDAIKSVIPKKPHKPEAEPVQATWDDQF